MYIEYVSRKLKDLQIFNLESEYTKAKKYVYLHSDEKLMGSKKRFLDEYIRIFGNLFTKKKFKNKYIDLKTYYSYFLNHTKADMKSSISIDTKKRANSQIKKLWSNKFDFIYPRCLNFRIISKKKSLQFFFEKINLKSENNHLNLNCMFLKKG